MNTHLLAGLCLMMAAGSAVAAKQPFNPFKGDADGVTGQSAEQAASLDNKWVVAHRDLAAAHPISAHAPVEHALARRNGKIAGPYANESVQALNAQAMAE